MRSAKPRLRARLGILFLFIAGLLASAAAQENSIPDPVPAPVPGPVSIQEQTPAPALNPAEVPLPESVSASAAEIAVEEEAPLFPELPHTPDGMGPAAWFYEARKIESELTARSARADASSEVQAESAALGIRMDFLYRLAFYFGQGAEAKEAGKILVQRRVKSSDHAGAYSLAVFWLEAFGPDMDMYTQGAAAALKAGEPRAALELVEKARKSLAAAARSRSGELSYYEYSARSALGDTGWADQAWGMLASPSLDAWGAKILNLVLGIGQTDQGGTPARASLARMRIAFQTKDYAAAAAWAVSSKDLILAPGALRHLASEAGRSFVYARDAAGLEFFASLFPEALPPGSAASSGTEEADRIAEDLASRYEESLWIGAYYLARLWQLSGLEAPSAALFLSLTEKAPSAADSDGALWYWLDITLKRIAQGGTDDIGAFSSAADLSGTQAAIAQNTDLSPAVRRPFEFAALVEASSRWKNAASFDDLLDGYCRSLLKEKAWNDALALTGLLGPQISPNLKPRFAYLGARLVEEGLATTLLPGPWGEDTAAFSRSVYESLTGDSGIEEYYRSLSAWRLGREPPFLAQMPALDKNPPAASGSTPPSAAPSPPLVENYLAFGLEELASTQALKYLGSTDTAKEAELALALSAEGQHYAALRLARDAVNRGLGTSRPELWALVYPLAWQPIVAQGASIPGIPEALAYAIIRSESVFDPKAVSYAGAVGLTQLMPATATETAKGLGMAKPDLTDPGDNVRIGMTYYSYMLSRFGGKPMRAMFAYNAGPSRMSAWSKESGELPDDILLETLHLTQPRQYAKNIIQAALAYGKIHYGLPSAQLLDYLVLGKPLAPPLPEPPLAVPPESPPSPPPADGQIPEPKPGISEF